MSIPFGGPIPSPPAKSFPVFRLLVSSLAAVVVLIGLAPASVDAHSGKQSYLYVSVYDDGVDGRLEIPVVDLERVLDAQIPQSMGGASEAVRALTGEIIGYVREHLSFADDDGPWTLDLGDVLQILPTENGPYVVLPFAIDENFDRAPRAFTVDLSVIIESDAEKDALLIIEDDWSSATFDNGSEPLLAFSTGSTEQRVELGGASTAESMLAIRGIGTDAVRTGIDSLLIVVGVVTAAVMVPTASRKRVVSPARVVRRLASGLLVLAAGHSVTLWVAGTGVLAPSPRLAGILTALGLALVAAFVLLAWWRPTFWSIATPVFAAVGVMQGFGLAAAFDAQDLDRRRPLTSLLAFNVGVEVAVLVLAVLVAIPLGLIRRTRLASAVTVGLGAALSGYALAWLCERLADTDWPIEEVADPLRVWPRNVVFVIIAIAVAAAIRQVEARSGRLREIEDPVAAMDRPPSREQEAALT